MKSEKAINYIYECSAGGVMRATDAAAAVELAEQELADRYEAQIAELRKGMTADAGSAMTLNDYQRQAMTTCLPSCQNMAYMLFGLVEEVGELSSVVSKSIRRRDVVLNFNSFDRYSAEFHEKFEAMKKEAGDILWMLSGFCEVHGWTLEDIARGNLSKLHDRATRGQIVEHPEH